MLRTILCVAIGLCLCGDVAMAKGGKGKGKNKGPSPFTIGTIKSVDAAAGTITVSATDKTGVSTDKSFSITDDTPISVANADGTTKDLKGKDGLKNEVVKEGASIQVTTDSTGAVSAVSVGGTYAQPKAKGKGRKKKAA